MGSEAELALLDALQSVGLEARFTESPHSRADIEVHTPDGRKVLIEAEYRSLSCPGGLRGAGAARRSRLALRASSKPKPERDRQHDDHHCRYGGRNPFNGFDA